MSSASLNVVSASGKLVHSLGGDTQVICVNEASGVMVNGLVIHIDVEQNGCQDTPLR